VTEKVVTPSVLVVTDDHALFAAAEEALGAFVAILPARSRRELVVQIARGAPFALVVCEIATPWTTGVEVMRACDARDVPIVFAADAGAPFTSEHLAHLGPRVRLVRRPFEVGEVAFTIADLFRRSRPGVAR